MVFVAHSTGKERDAETGNDYFGKRYYASSMGRFLSPDLVGDWAASPGDPQSWNQYAYVDNNPLTMVDPDGTCPVIIAGIGMSPDLASGQNLIVTAGLYGADVEFDYAGQSKAMSIAKIALSGFGANGAATESASGAMSAAFADANAGRTSFFALAFSGGVQASISAGVGTGAMNPAAFYDPGTHIFQRTAAAEWVRKSHNTSRFYSGGGPMTWTSLQLFRVGKSCSARASHSIRSFFGFAVLAAFAFCTSAVCAQHPQKLWSVDLAKDIDFAKRLGVLEVSLDAPSINFLSNSQIICDFYDGEKGGYNLSMPPSGYHVLEIDANNGAFGPKLNFQPVDDHSRALPTDDGGFVVFTGKDLKKFNNEFVPVVGYPTPREQVGDVLDRWLVDVSPSLQTILVYHGRPGDTQDRWTWLRAKDLTISNSIQGPLAMIVQASDTGAIFGGGINEMQLLSAAGKSAAICARCNAYFLSDDMIFVDEGKSYTIETTTGENRRKENLGMGGGNLALAAHSRRFVYVTGSIGGWGFPIQTHFNKISGKIRVWDWTTNKVITQIDINEPVGNPSAGLSQMAVALSPDGKFLVVLLHHTLTLYRLP